MNERETSKNGKSPLLRVLQTPATQRGCEAEFGNIPFPWNLIAAHEFNRHDPCQSDAAQLCLGCAVSALRIPS